MFDQQSSLCGNFRGNCALQAVQGIPCQWNGSDSGVSDSHSVAPADTDPPAERNLEKRQNPGGDQGYDANTRSVSSDGTDDCQWRRRELNPPLSTSSAIRKSFLTNVYQTNNSVKVLSRFSSESASKTLMVFSQLLSSASCRRRFVPSI